MGSPVRVAAAVAIACVAAACSLLYDLRDLRPSGADAGASDGGPGEAASDAGPDAAPTMLVSGISALDLRVDDTSVYWTDTSFLVGRASKVDGSNASTVADSTSTSTGVSGLALDLNDLYFGSAVTGDIFTCPKSGCGGPARAVTNAASNSIRPVRAIELDATNVYWIDTPSNALYTVPKGSLAALPIVVADFGSQPNGLRVVDGKAYAPLDGGGVGVIDLATKSLSKLPTLTQRPCSGEALNGTSVYFTEFADAGALGSVDTSGGTVTQLASGLLFPFSLVADGSQVFWIELGADFSTGTVSACSIASCTPRLIADHQLTPYAIDMDDSFVYWANAGSASFAKDGSIWRAPS